MAKYILGLLLSPVLVTTSSDIQQTQAVLSQMHEQVTELKLQLIESQLMMDEIILDDIQQEHLRALQEHQRRMTPLQCLTDNIYYEASGEPYEGKVAVAQVTLNRVADDFGGDTVCGVVYFKKINPYTGKKEAAFSWTLGWKWKPHHRFSRRIYRQCEQIARAMLSHRLSSDLIGADVEYYHANYVHPVWADDHPVAAVIGNHVFYRE